MVCDRPLLRPRRALSAKTEMLTLHSLGTSTACISLPSGNIFSVMASVLDSAEFIDSDDQTAFNVAVWNKVLSDHFLAGLPHRIETDRYGQIIMSPPPDPEHGEKQAEIGALLKKLIPRGDVITECPVSTSEGVKGVDVTWISKERRALQRGHVCFTQAPEICVEVISPGNTSRELREKKALFFSEGAEEVWFCHRDGRMEFFLKAAPDNPAGSVLCPIFPKRLELQ
jgi:Uma2 family endonuclease